MRWNRQGFCGPCKEFRFSFLCNEKAFEGLTQGVNVCFMFIEYIISAAVWILFQRCLRGEANHLRLS